jgi:hypothetical protein
MIPDTDVLSVAPTPEAAPTRPWARLNRPVPAVRSATISAVRTPSVAPLSPELDDDKQNRIGRQCKKRGADRNGGEPDDQERLAAEGCGAASRPRSKRGDDHLRKHDKRRDHERRQAPFRVRERLAELGQQGGIAELKQQKAEGENQKTFVLEQVGALHPCRVGGVMIGSATGSGEVNVARTDPREREQ